MQEALSSTMVSEKQDIKDLVGKIWNEDCLKTMARMEDNSVDLVLTDPPYGIGENNERNMSRGKWSIPTNYGHYEWDNQKIDDIYFEEIKRISKNQIIFGGNYYNLGSTSCYLVWDKDNGNSDFADAELAWTSFKSAVRIFKFKWQGMLQENMKNKEKRYHPTQKPVELIRQILDRYSNPDESIYDPFCGSGSILLAAQKLGHNWIGSEINPEYCDIANKRISAERNQTKLF